MKDYKFYSLVVLLVLNILTTLYLSTVVEDYIDDADSRLGMVCGYVIGNE